MKRLLSAALLAVMLHAWLFRLDFGWMINKAVRQQPDTTTVTITMSYRQPETAPETMEHIRQIEEKPREVKIDKRPKKERPKQIAKIHPSPVVPKQLERREPDDVGEKNDNAAIETTLTASSSTDAQSDQNMTAAVTGTGVVHVTKDAIPSYRVNPTPTYPRTARKRGFQGIVVLSVFVDEKGKVSNLWVSTSSGYILLDNAAVKAVKDWAFEPGMKGDKRIAMWVKVPIRFQLKP
jgi:periplasmic protein TonB